MINCFSMSRNRYFRYIHDRTRLQTLQRKLQHHGVWLPTLKFAADGIVDVCLVTTVVYQQLLQTIFYVQQTLEVLSKYKACIYIICAPSVCASWVFHVPHKKLATFSEKLYLTVEQLDIMSIYTLCILGVIFKPMSE